MSAQRGGYAEVLESGRDRDVVGRGRVRDASRESAGARSRRFQESEGHLTTPLTAVQPRPQSRPHAWRPQKERRRPFAVSWQYMGIQSGVPRQTRELTFFDGDTSYFVLRYPHTDSPRS